MIRHHRLLPTCAFSEGGLLQRKHIYEGHATFKVKHTFSGIVALQGSIYLCF